MDELIGGMLLLLVAGVVISLLIAVALAMVSLAAVVGSLMVGVGGAWEFVMSLGRRVRSRGGADRRVLTPEPAFELYVLGQLGRDLRSAGTDAWGVMQRLRGLTGKFAADHGDGMTLPLGIGALVGGFVGTGLGAVVAGLLTLPVLIVAGVVMAGAWALIGVLRAAEAVRKRVRRAGYECPVDHERFPLPVYVCPGCGIEHRRLVPGRWGIVKRECECGRVALPTMVLNGRQRIPQRCPSGHPIAGIIGYAENLRLALVAGPRAGKSTFLAGALHELDRLSKSGTLALAVVDDSRSDFEAALDDLEHGRLPAKTQVGRSPALVAEVQGGGRSRALSIYDVAGESYLGDDDVRDLRFLEVPSGLVLLVDPLALERFAADHRDEIAAAEDSLRPSPVQPIRVLERTLGALQAAGANSGKLPLAVVVAKADALGVGDEIAALGQAEGDGAARTWLERQGAGNFVRTVENEFPNVGWFYASALGRAPDPADGAAFVPAGTADPVLWLLRQNGVVPAAERFSPAKAAERLSGAVAADFPPIGPRGWAWRAVPATLVSLAVVAALGFGIASGVRALPDGPDRAAFASGGGGGDADSYDSAADYEDDYEGDYDAQYDTDAPPATMLPAVGRREMARGIRNVLLAFHRHVIYGDYRAAWGLLSKRKQAQVRREDGYPTWSEAQATLRNDLDPERIRVRIDKASPETGVVRVDVRGMTWSKPGAGCVEWSGLTWVKYENGRWRYDPGYSTTPERRRKWERRFSELLGAGC